MAASSRRVAYRAARILSPDLQWRTDAHLVVEDGCIVGIIDDAPHDTSVVDLGPCAIVPGQINAHSHAFQRGIRGLTEGLPDASSTHDDFWTWRTQMYRLALNCQPEDVRAIAQMAFVEMALSGITAVGEFHYVHHQPDGTPYDDVNTLAHAVIEAARTAGIRITLLKVAYERAGHGRDPNPDQRRFYSDVDDYIDSVEALHDRWAGTEGVHVGVAPHSVRAVGRETLKRIAEYVNGRPQPAHIHACEQTAELEQCDAEYGMGPVQLLEDVGFLNRGATLVHGIHLDAGALELLERAQATVCACPSTERNLGDGVVPAFELMSRQVPICLGSDSHTLIDPWAEMRQVEYHERLLRQRRNVLARFHPSGQTARSLWPMGTTHGAQAIGQRGGALSPGSPADFVALDLEHVALAGACSGDLLADIVFSMPNGAVRDVYVGGRAIVQGGVHPLARRTVKAFAQVMTGLRA
ncbi:MAG: formimidoylglutamate deiminase [Bradymonadia bacterium]